MYTRLNEIEFLFSYMFRKSTNTSRKIILSTSCGKRILENSPSILYEQPTANFKELIMELEKHNVYRIDLSKNTNTRLKNAYIKLCDKKYKQFCSVSLKYSALNENEKAHVKTVIRDKKRAMNASLVKRNKQNLAFLKFKRRYEI